MMTLSDENWIRIVSSCRAPANFRQTRELPLGARQEIESVLTEHIEFAKQEAIYHVTPETRVALERSQRAAERLSRQLGVLKARYDLGRIAKAFGEPTIDSHVTGLDALAGSLGRAAESLQFRSRNKTWMRRYAGVLFIELLEVRSYYLEVDAPNQSKETSSSGAFREFLDICLGLAEPLLSSGDRKQMLEQGIDYAVEIFQLYKSDEEFCWKWQDIFPQSDRSLMKSSKIWRD